MGKASCVVMCSEGSERSWLGRRVDTVLGLQAVYLDMDDRWCISSRLPGMGVHWAKTIPIGHCEGIVAGLGS